MRPLPALLACALVGTSIGCASAPAGVPRPATSPATDPQRAAVMAVVDSALVHINRGNMVALSDLMLPEGQVFPARDRDGQGTVSVRTAAAQRAAGARDPIIERGFNPEVRIAGTIAAVWLPYDLWANGTWSHCGVDQFTLVRVGAAWRIANLTYSVEQPPACRMHPDGPPPGYSAPGGR